MPTIQPPEKHRSLWKQLFGQSEKDNFVEGIKNRREGSDKADLSDFFFDPATSEISAPMGMMTRYLKGGVPDVAKRIEGTESFRSAARAMGIDTEKAAELFAERYPRVAAHMGIKPLGNLTQMGRPGLRGLTYTGRRVADAMEKTPVSIKPGKDVEETLLHEGTHVAQELGNKNFGLLYDKSSEALKPALGEAKAYHLNPFEVSARAVARRKMGAVQEPLPALRMVDMIIDKLPAGNVTRRDLAAARRK